MTQEVETALYSCIQVWAQKPEICVDYKIDDTTTTQEWLFYP